MNENAILKVGAAPVTDAIETFLKVFPLTQDDYTDPKNLTEDDYQMTRAAYAHLSKMGISTFIKITPFPDTDNAVSIHVAF